MPIQTLQQRFIKERQKRLALAKDLRNCKSQCALSLRNSNEIQKKTQKFSRLLILKQEEERRSISRELHDELGQILTGINFQLAILSKEAANSNQALREKIARTQSLVEDSVKVVHRFARELRPAILDDLGLVAALRSYAREYTKQTSIPVRIAADSKIGKLNEIGKTVLFRAAQEALNNVAKHSRATKVVLTIVRKNKFIQMEIRDNGKSFRTRDVFPLGRTRSIGLLGMKERVRLASGDLQIFPRPGRGTKIRIQIPFAEVASSSAITWK